MNPYEQPDTKTKLLMTASELFALNGYEGTSVRDIIQKAGTTLSAVNYHFGSKKQLYVDSVREILTGLFDSSNYFDMSSAATFSDPQQAADLLLPMCRKLVKRFFGPEQPEWRGKLIDRLLVETIPENIEIISDLLFPFEQTLHTALSRLAPESTFLERNFAILTMRAHVHHLASSRDYNICVFGIEKYDDEFLHRVSLHIARHVASALHLPEPCEHSN